MMMEQRYGDVPTTTDIKDKGYYTYLIFSSFFTAGIDFAQKAAEVIHPAEELRGALLVEGSIERL